ncbi:MAG: helix-turn-helix domain-containing protein [Cetobacterium sp.]|nr:helix-turn-helix domain-containing protein [Cetobacterium sp.]
MQNYFSSNIKYIRNTCNLTQAELAKKIGITGQAISKYEQGKAEPGLYALHNLAQMFNCSIDTLIFKDMSKENIDIQNLKTFENYTHFDLLKFLNEKQQYLENELRISEITTKNIKTAISEIIELKKKLSDNKCSNDNINCEFSDELSPYENKIDNLDNDINAFDDEISSSDKINTNNIISIHSKLESKREEQLLDCTDIDFDSIEYTNIPYISDVSAGLPSLIYEDYRGECKVPDDYIYPNQNYFILRINGESMNKIYKYGELVLIRQCSYVNNGSMAVVSVNRDTATLKKYYYDAKTRTVSLEPLSDCDNFDIQYYDVDVDNIEIIGEVEYILKY